MTIKAFDETLMHALDECDKREKNGRVGDRSQVDGYAGFVSPWDEMMKNLNTLATRLYDEDRGDEGCLIIGAIKRLSKQKASIAHYQHNEKDHRQERR